MFKNLTSIHPISLNIIIGTLFSRMATFMTIPFLAIYLTSSRGISPAIVGAIIGVSSLIGLFGGFIGGHISDRIGREKVMVGSIFVWIFVFIGFALAEHAAIFFILNALNGICRSFFEPSARALLSDVTKNENKLMVFNLRYTAINIGAALGPLIGLKLGTAESTSGFFITAIIYGMYLLSILFIFPRYREHITIKNKQDRVTLNSAIKILSKDTLFLLAIIGFILGVAGYSQFTSTLPQYLASSSTFSNGVTLYTYLIVINAITVLIVQYPVTRIGKYLSPLFSIMLGTLTVCGGLIGIGMATTPLELVVSLIFFTIGEVMMFTMTDLFVDQIALSHMKGVYFGAMGFTGAGGAFGPWIGGILLAYFGFSNPVPIFSLLAMISGLGFPLLLFVYLKMKRTNRIVQYNFTK
jgi:MFS family permease